PPFDIVDRAAVAALGLANGTWRPKRRSRGLVDTVLELPLVRSYVVGRARADVDRRTRGNYPAPLAALSCVETGLGRGERAGLECESSGFGRLSASPEAKALIGLFLATNELKKGSGDAAPRKVERVGVLGAGLMGAGIAGASLDQVPVTMRDVSLEALS